MRVALSFLLSLDCFGLQGASEEAQRAGAAFYYLLIASRGRLRGRLRQPEGPFYYLLIASERSSARARPPAGRRTFYYLLIASSICRRGSGCPGS